MKIAVVLVLSILLVGCFMQESDPHISGTVTVVDEADWAKIHIGVFFASDDYNSDPYALNKFKTEYAWDGMDPVYIYRAIYENLNNNVVHEFTPELATSATISQTTGLNGIFRADFDENGNPDGYYYVLAWLDDVVVNDKLDLKDSNNTTTQITDSEFNRCPRYNSGGDDAFCFVVSSTFGYMFDAGSSQIDLSSIDPGDFSIDMTPAPAPAGW